MMSRKPPPTLVAALGLTTALACSVAALHRPTSCREDAECPPDARCLQNTCTADVPPRASIAGPRTAAAGTELAFEGGGSSDPDDDIVDYTWSVRVLSGSCAPELGASGLQAFRPVFGCPGEFEIILVVRDRAGVVSDPAIARVTVVAP